MVIHTIFTSPQYVLKLSQTDDGIRDAPPSWIFQFLLPAGCTGPTAYIADISRNTTKNI